MRLVVFGAGALGGLLGARLIASGARVLLVARPPTVAEVRQHGLRIEDDPPVTYHPEAVDRLGEREEADAVLLTVKSSDLEAAADEIARSFPAGVPVLVLGNGLGIEERLVRQLAHRGWPDAAARLVRAVTSVPATLLAPGVVRPGGAGEILLAGIEDHAVPPIAERLRLRFEAGGVRVRLVADLSREVWRKALVNAAINPVTADHGIANGGLVDEPWRGQALALLREARTVARAEGYEFSEEEAERDLWTVVRATAANRSSMLQDLDRGRPTEIDAISGEILRRGGAHGLALPATARVVRRLHDRVHQRRAAEGSPPARAQAS